MVLRSFGAYRDLWFNDIIVYSISSCTFTRKNGTRLHENLENSITVVAMNGMQDGGSFEEQGTVSYSLNLAERKNGIFVNPFDMDDEDLTIDTIGRILQILPISSLNIAHKEIFIGTLISLIPYLPNLRSLVVSSLALVHPRCLYPYEVTALRGISNTNKITRVNLQWMSDLAQVQFLLDPCPRVEHLEVDCVNSVSPENSTRFLFLKNIKCIPHLSSLYLNVLPTQELPVDKLKRTIALEQLRANHTIQQLDNQIHFVFSSL